jgi:dephospho-CoA kinase
MKTIGITGGIGSGKTTFCKHLERPGTVILYADFLAKKLMQDDPELKKRIISTFGEESYQQDGSLNRDYLSFQAFSQNKVEDLNNLVHPVVKQEVLKMIKTAINNGVDLFVYEAALLLKSGRPDFLDIIVWIESPTDERAKRVSNRDNVDVENVLKRMQHQQNFESVRDFVDIVITNDGSLDDLKSKADDFYNQMLNL